MDGSIAELATAAIEISALGNPADDRRLGHADLEARGNHRSGIGDLYACADELSTGRRGGGTDKLVECHGMTSSSQIAGDVCRTTQLPLQVFDLKPLTATISLREECVN
jgi:hypothetical protein